MAYNDFYSGGFINPNMQQQQPQQYPNPQMLGATPAQINAMKAMQTFQPNQQYSEMQAMQMQVMQMQAMGMQNPYGLSINARGELKIPAATTQNVCQFIYQALLQAQRVNVPFEMLEFVKITEPFASQGNVRHACKFNMLQLDELAPTQIQYFDKATIEFAYCPNCYRVVYYLDKLI